MKLTIASGCKRVIHLGCSLDGYTQVTAESPEIGRERGHLRRIGPPWKLLLLAGCIITGTAQAAPDNGRAEYVDARVCASCHRQIAEEYRQTGMGRSFFRPAPANTIEDYTKNNEF